MDGETIPDLLFRELSQVPVRIEEDAVVLLRCTAAQLQHAEPDVIPSWVSQSVLHGNFAPRDSLKLSFFLSPHPGGSLPPLPPGSNKLSAAKVLKVHKVASYVIERLQLTCTAGSLQLLCNDKLLASEMSLASVRAFVWKNGSDDMLIHYR